MDNGSTDFKDIFFVIFDLIRDFFAAVGATTVILSTIFYLWGYFP